MQSSQSGPEQNYPPLVHIALLTLSCQVLKRFLHQKPSATTENYVEEVSRRDSMCTYQVNAHTKHYTANV